MCAESNERLKIVTQLFIRWWNRPTALVKSQVKTVTEGEVNRESKLGKFPVLVYETNQDRVIWKVKRYFGKLNVTVHEFDIDAETGEILKHEELSYRRTIWQWVVGTEI